MRIIAPIIIVVIAIAFTAVVIDCVSGHWTYYNGTITNHRYVPASTSTDSDGHTISSSEEFHLGFVSKDGVDIDLSVTQSCYNGIQDGSEVWVKTREGRLGHYLSHIVSRPDAEK
jgi:hypothetical protein